MYQNRSGFLGSIPPVTRNLIIINLLVWFATVALPNNLVNSLYQYLGLHYFASEYFNPAQLVTYMFMHGNFSHVFFNMFAVFMFGRTLELVWGPKCFLIFYFITGIGAGLIQELVCGIRIYQFTGEFAPDLVSFVTNKGADMSMNQIKDLAGLVNSLTVGASGAVFGILLAFGMLFPNAELFLIFIPIPIKAKYFVVLYGLAELYFGIANYGGDNVAHFAHLGGMLFGYFMIKYWRKKDINDRDLNNNGRFFR
ncbi:MAG: rhomboid family intramembrane serine protease [Candidatus Azobacteroides sp.]|nr:rhomboid family intramembrane serine protease [Candidatus Azobacteroides sp.]